MKKILLSVAMTLALVPGLSFAQAVESKGLWMTKCVSESGLTLWGSFASSGGKIFPTELTVLDGSTVKYRQNFELISASAQVQIQTSVEQIGLRFPTPMGAQEINVKAQSTHLYTGTWLNAGQSEDVYCLVY